MQYLNTYRPAPLPAPFVELHENTPVQEYDLNSVLPVPQSPLETEKLRIEPLIPILHAQELSDAFMKPSQNVDDVWFYPFPNGKPYENKEDTLKYMEKQRRRPNVLTFAAIDKQTGKLAGVLALGCDPAQATLDVKIMGIKIFPEFRGTHVFTHACHLLLAYAFDKLHVVRVGWRTTPENIRSQKAAEKLGLAREGTMRCYEVSPPMPGSPYPHFTIVEDGSGRVTEDGVVYSMTIHDWLRGKRERLQNML
ncbi:acyl-CoA N-acyltransferase [Hymenopellis radicata]|nr:acyl-CoA N-acyltransferase [Hymenopellis radicata]